MNEYKYTLNKLDKQINEGFKRLQTNHNIIIDNKQIYVQGFLDGIRSNLVSIVKNLIGME